MAGHKEYERALAFCRQAALLQPRLSNCYADALLYAEQGRDSKAMEWAVEQLLNQDWPASNQQLHALAQLKAEAFAGVLEQENRRTEAERIRDALQRLQRRDLVVRLTWENGAQPSDVELTVQEPCGSVASLEQRQTAGGGAYLANSLLQLNRVTYTAAQAFAGEYEIGVRRNWGQPLRNEARLEIIQHLGMPQESKRVEIIDLDRPQSLKVRLEDGRRTTLASVASLPEEDVEPLPPETDSKVLGKLRELASYDFTGVRSEAAPRMRGNSGTPGARLPAVPVSQQPERNAGQVALPPQTGSGVAWNAQAAVSTDRRYVRVSLNPVFGSTTRTPAVELSAIPGGVTP
jgi:hypothetical protein